MQTILAFLLLADRYCRDGGDGTGMAAVRGVYPALHPHAEMEKIGICGHCPMQETPIHFATGLQAFISRSA
jgi:pimeloyl-ACP methyl ester carboxylesterase